MFTEPYLQFRSNTILQYNIAPRPPKGSQAFEHRALIQSRLYDNLREHATYTGILTPGAKKRLTRCIELLIQSAKHQTVIHPTKGYKFPFKVGFMTLTIHSPDRNITQKEAHSTCLEPFLQWVRRVHGCKLYLWKAELQMRGQIHYHITLGTFIHYNDIRKKWNELQQRAGYLNEFHAQYGHYDAPSTEIKSVRKVSNLPGYILKEVTKSYQNANSVHGKVWDCSNNLKESKYYVTVADGDYSQRICKAIDSGEVQAVYTDHCTIFRVINKPAHYLLSQSDKAEYVKLMDSVRTQDVIRVKAVKVEPEFKQPVISKAEYEQTALSIACRTLTAEDLKRESIKKREVKRPNAIDPALLNKWINDFSSN